MSILDDRASRPGDHSDDLRTNANLLSLIYDSTSDPVYLVRVEGDGEYRFVSVNRSFLGVTGYEAHQVVEAPMERVVPPPNVALVRSQYERAIAERKPIVYEEKAELPAGTRYAEITLIPVFEGTGPVTHILGDIKDVTPRMERETALRQSELRYRTLFEAAKDAIFLMRGDLFIDCNAQASVLFGCPREKIVGQTPFYFSPPEQSDGRPSDEKAAEMIGKAMKEGSNHFEWTHCRLDRTIVETEVTLARTDLPGDTFLLAIVRDITARRKVEADLAHHRAYLEDLVQERTSLLERELANHRTTERNLRQSERLLRAVLDSIDAAVYVADLQTYEVLLVNAYVRQFFGDVTGKVCWHSIQSGQSGPCSFCTNQVLVDSRGRPTGVHGWEFQNTVTGQWFQCRDVAIPWVDGRMVRLEIAADVTELHRQREKAESADRLKSAFLAAMSHELRTPLNSIIGFSGILLQGLAGPLNAEQARQMAMVCSSADHLLALINDVLDVSRIEAGQMQLVPELFDVKASIEKAVAAVRPQVEKKHLELAVDVAPGVGTITSDRRRVEQVLLNLLSNGIKFTERGTIRVSASAQDGRVTVTVTDSGPGIKEEDQQRLFRPFSQIHGGTNRMHEGTGLGLSISKRLVELLGGSIWVKSEWGRGSTFGFDVPVERGAAK